DILSRAAGERRLMMGGQMSSVSGGWAAVAGLSCAATKEKLASTVSTLVVLHCRELLLKSLLQCYAQVHWNRFLGAAARTPGAGAGALALTGAAAAAEGRVLQDAELSRALAGFLGVQEPGRASVATSVETEKGGAGEGAPSEEEGKQDGRVVDTGTPVTAAPATTATATATATSPPSEAMSTGTAAGLAKERSQRPEAGAV
ncbi:unnamed protein product, partial [Discosporangium mesarthrocarpum]